MENNIAVYIFPSGILSQDSCPKLKDFKSKEEWEFQLQVYLTTRIASGDSSIGVYPGKFVDLSSYMQGYGKVSFLCGLDMGITEDELIRRTGLVRIPEFLSDELHDANVRFFNAMRFMGLRVFLLSEKGSFEYIGQHLTNFCCSLATYSEKRKDEFENKRGAWTMDSYTEFVGNRDIFPIQWS